MTQKIIPHLWFDKEAVEATEFYKIVFPNSEIISKSIIKNLPARDCDLVEFSVMNYRLMAISAGPDFKLNPSISFILNFDPIVDKNAKDNLDSLWEKLAEGGEILLPLQINPPDLYYGWLNDKFGVSWQLIFSKSEGDPRPFILPTLMFVGDVVGKAEDAIKFYLSVFNNAKRGVTEYYSKDMEPDKEGTIMFADFMIENQWFVAMDSAYDHEFAFNEALSFVINCEDQEEIDYYWERLSAVPEKEQCGWILDKYGISWQILPKNMYELIAANPEKTTPVMLKMKKIIIRELEEAGKKK